mmetsp:Transcript_13722/g.43176  ORF Transcript_13722/g.43176 Transcript_13722/m.43176 type:complete len:220 (-) Transcript_13722:794-1453(-)
MRTRTRKARSTSAWFMDRDDCHSSHTPHMTREKSMRSCGCSSQYSCSSLPEMRRCSADSRSSCQSATRLASTPDSGTTDMSRFVAARSSLMLRSLSIRSSGNRSRAVDCPHCRRKKVLLMAGQTCLSSKMLRETLSDDRAIARIKSSCLEGGTGSPVKVEPASAAVARASERPSTLFMFVWSAMPSGLDRRRRTLESPSRASSRAGAPPVSCPPSRTSE